MEENNQRKKFSKLDKLMLAVPGALAVASAVAQLSPNDSYFHQAITPLAVSLMASSVVSALYFSGERHSYDNHNAPRDLRE